MKYHFFPSIRYITVAVAVVQIFYANAETSLLRQIPPQSLPRDSVLLQLQSYLDSNYKIIDSYYKKISEKQVRESEKDTVAKRLLQVNDSMNVLLKSNFFNMCAQHAAVTTPDWKTELKMLYDSLVRMEKEAEALKTRLTDTLASSWNLADSLAKSEQERYNAVSRHMASMSDKLEGAGTLNIPVGDKVTMYRFFIVSKAQYVVQVHNSSGGPASIERLRKTLAKKTEPVMITNAGMFQPGYSAQGLLIQDTKLIHALDTGRPYKSNLNFYLLPNGVFYMDAAGNFKIDETRDFQNAYPAQIKKLPLFATQSGPMLLNKDSINSNFRVGSANINIRSGVGMIDSSRVVFIISDNPVNFHDFTLVFKEIFKCNSALYLDGAISEMYINDKLLDNKKAVINGNFGPLISIIKKKKS